ncbi:MAG: hypothetical protein V8Q79_09895 [Christensenellales bacterium]
MDKSILANCKTGRPAALNRGSPEDMARRPRKALSLSGKIETLITRMAGGRHD